MLVRSTRNCPNTPKVLLALHELGIAYDATFEADGWFREHVGCGGPTLEDGELVVIEINAILRHIGRRYGFLPQDEATLVEADRWLEMYRRIAEKAEASAHLIGFVERRLEGRDWLLDTFSVVDCAYVPFATVPYWHDRLPLDGAPRFAAFLTRLADRYSRSVTI
jgi:glutathione S-transferase